MGLFDFISNQFIEVIDWTDPTNDTLVYRFPVENREIKMGAQLTVRESQVAVFINEGRVADVFEPGRHTLSTQNLPVMTKLKSWKYGFNSPFKAEVYFINTRIFTDQKWGTSNPITLRDPDFGVVRVRAFGNFSFRVSNPEKFLKDIVGTDGHFTLDEIRGQQKTMVVSGFTALLGESRVAALDLASRQEHIATLLKQKLDPEFAEHGLSLVKVMIENASLPPEVEKMIDKRTSMGVVGDMGRFTQFELANSLGQGSGGAGMARVAAEFAAGAALGQSMQQSMGQGSSLAAPPPLPGQESWHYAGADNQQVTLTGQEIAARVAANPTARHLVWKQGMAGWSDPKEVAALKQLIDAAAPPPLPTAPPPLPGT